MTKRELIQALDRFGDDQFVFVSLHGVLPSGPAQVIIQGIVAVPPWHDAAADESNFLIGLEAHPGNVPLKGRR